jgi:hypothetical protein
MGSNHGAAGCETGVMCGEICVRRAGCRGELEEAYHLVYRNYRQQGYIERNEAQIRVSVFNAFPSTVTFVGMLEQQVVATVTLVPDTPVGLPMDSIYHEELRELRDEGRELAEVTMLADRRHELRRSLPVLLSLMKQLFDYATLVLEANDLCITINPRHESYYTRYLLFEPMGELKLYPSVQNNPALALRLDLDNVREKCRGNQRLLQRFFTGRTPLDALCSGYYMSPEDLEHFFVRQTSTFQRAAPEHIEHLRGLYPECPWDRWCAGEPALHD